MATGTESALLQPASIREIGAFLATLPSRPRLTWWALLIGNFAVALTAMVVTSSAIGALVDIINGIERFPFGTGQRAFWLMIVVITTGLFLDTVGRAYGQYIVSSRARLLSVDVRRSCLVSALRAPIPDIVALGTGNVITRLTKDIDEAVRIANMIGVRLIITCLMFPFTFVALGLIHWGFVVAFIVVMLAIYPFAKANLALLPTATNSFSDAEAQRNNLLLDTIKGLPTLRALGLRDWATRRLEHTSWQTVIKAADRMPLVTRLLRHGTIAYTSIVVVCFCIATWLTHNGHITFGQATAAITLVSRMEMHVFNVMFFSGDIQNALTSLGRAVRLATLNQQHTKPTPADLRTPPTVSVRDLTFAYPSGATVFNSINLTLAAGTTTALVGASGAGKSTLAGIIAGLQRPTSGHVYIGDHATDTIDDAWTSRHVALISQEVHIFAGTLRDDLSMAKPEASDADILDALAEVGLHPQSAMWQRWLPHGLDTMVGAGAAELAPEIQQQISLARIILLQPPVLIMDEATAEAGSENARQLEAAATAVARGRTSLIVAHRLDQAQLADRIIVMDNGEIVEDGTHDFLLEAGGRYAELFKKWQ